VALIWSGSSLLGKIKVNTRREKSKDFEVRLRLDQNVGVGWLDRLK